MRCITDVRRIILNPLSYIALSVLLTQSAVLGAPISPPNRVGAPVGYFSPVLGARFEIVQVRIASGGLVNGARLVEEPIAGSPLEGEGLVVGDTITHLDGTSVSQTSELERHEQNTKVSWIADKTQVTRSFNIFIQRGKRFTDPTGLGPNTGVVGPPIVLGADLTGQWNCTCGAVWTLNQRGRAVTGDESDSQSTNRVVGTFNGRTFSFTYSHQDGYSGTGTFTPNRALTSMSGTIRWDNGTSSSPTLTRVVARPGPRPNPNSGSGTRYTVIGLRNNSNQLIECELRWNGGAWEKLQLQPNVPWTYWLEGHGQRPQLRKGSQILDLTGAGVTLQRQPSIQDASVYGISEFSGQLYLAQ
jgi:hypothetical protein